jgi:DmsE family decaheme c-type cytochrome
MAEDGAVNNRSIVEVYLGPIVETSTVGPEKFGSKFRRARVFLVASTLIFCSSAVGLPESAKAGATTTVADIDRNLRGLPQQTVTSQQSSQVQQANADDAPIAALSSFAQQIVTKASKPTSATAAAASSNSQFDDEDYAALQAFAQRLGADQPASIKDQPKLAENRYMLDSLQQMLNKGSAPTPAASPPKAKNPAGPPVEATYVGAKACLTCHASQAAAFEKTLMGRIGKTQKGKFDCENCHGPGSAHVKAGGGRGVGGMISFRPEDQSRSAEENNGICLSCHERGDRTNWHGSTHETRGLMCTNCHTIMKAESRKYQLKTALEPETCFQCHKDRRAQMFRSSHMPLREGKVVCSDCHNPHGSATAALLRADSINETCYKCHAEKRGPFLFEHVPVRENCDNCHDPHGSVNQFLLKMPRPRLCTECHTFGHGTFSGPNVVQAMSRQCQNCHTEVHGTNDPSGALLHR